jgi:hypothetical protein
MKAGFFSSTLSATTVAAVVSVQLTGCATMQMGSTDAKTVATGSAGGEVAENANTQLERCATSLGTLAVIEDTSAAWYGILTGQMRLGSTTPVLKLLVQQSNCFVVVDRGKAMGGMMNERALQASGELRKGSRFGKGQMVAADYSLSPSITFSNQNAGGAGAMVGGMFGIVGALIASGLSVKEASTLLTLVENRSGVQVAAAEGSARNVDFNLLGGAVGGGLGGLGGGYSNTAEGKVIVAAFTDSYNNIVRATRAYRAQHVKGGLGTGGKLRVQGGK